jgi:ferrous iron transport protein A
VVSGLECGRELKLRLMAMGLVRGTMVRVRGRAPMGDPTYYEVKGYSLTMRKEEAECVLVEPLEAASLAQAGPGRWRVVGVDCRRCMRLGLWQVGVVEDAELVKLAGSEPGKVTIEVKGERQTFGADLAAHINVVRAGPEEDGSR